MGVEIKDVEHIAKLARLELTDEEKATYQHQLDAILGYMKQLEEADTSSVEPLAHVLGKENVMREDEPREFPARQAILDNLPEREYDLAKVRKVL
ncbi:MAG TPA: Asp-tRNA(Asn)/Glu-tRNA(Gln) amidotransferase subunit GatC [Elusimicrobiales bacterium]|nr:Asp-tRNA(Asn)/Glu-tRNA(Gln) amidotransferase subunit GatC [Elusimicrobiales bacterium]